MPLFRRRKRSEVKEDENERPIETPLGMQRLPSWKNTWSPSRIVTAYIIIAVIMIPLGIYFVVGGNQSWKTEFRYDNQEDCHINTENEGKKCTVSFTIDKDLDGPVYAYYQISDFYQNRRKYVSSYDQDQLLGNKIVSTRPSCSPFRTQSGLDINPCGVVANTLFNDIFNVTEGPEMIETGIAWESDVKQKFNQPRGFVTSPCESLDCEACLTESYPDTGDNYSGCKDTINAGIAMDKPLTPTAFWYPNDNTTLYLYEIYPEIISPLDGVENEHFIVWMRVSATSKVRKLYGIFKDGLTAGQKVTFDITNNYVLGNETSKWIILLKQAHTSTVPGMYQYTGDTFLIVGCTASILGIFVVLTQMLYPRKMVTGKRKKSFL